MAKKKPTDALARRERQIMDVIHQLGVATVGVVLEQLPDPPSYSSVRTMIRHLESKGHLSHRQDGKRYVYKATQSREVASRSALRKLLTSSLRDRLRMPSQRFWMFRRSRWSLKISIGWPG